MLQRTATAQTHPVEPRAACRRRFSVALIAVSLSSCSGQQSALAPAGEEAEAIFGLLLVAVIGGLFIWCGVIGLLVYAGRANRRVCSDRTGQRLILWGGALGPAIILTVLLAYALWLMPGTRPWFRGDGGDTVRIAVRGEQFWWRIAYLGPDGDELFQTANEIRMPVGKRIEFALTSTDVIHSFWIPSLAGKMDMIPGRTNVLSMTATRPGIYRGPCAEFCGTSHALMAFSVIAASPPEFEDWLAEQRLDRPVANAGADLFRKHGCSACHTVRQIGARGTLGPDLSNLGARQTVGAGILPNTKDNIALFIRDAAVVKPGARMPSFAMLPPADISAIADFLKGLK
ncbi:cytochrome c oxidase subunit II [Pararhizobium sp.]|uniref:cytochrome c oxidase subunit II n=1 Tax=Pararhizobium sp. TaxID=1977563 RepID=UPI002716BCE2|nr:cytochrome c oxidase subunit II [Pararhizobium sp.]MDO9418501.1 cytochrome c oxidase subunit II [Pararhizobium sp.]